MPRPAAQAVSILHFYFGWPEGAVWSNLLASAICAGLVWWRLRARMIAHHVEQLAQRERHHEELKAHVTAAAARAPKTLVRKPGREAGA
jgi:hypothetical protein